LNFHLPQLFAWFNINLIEKEFYMEQNKTTTPPKKIKGGMFGYTMDFKKMKSSTIGASISGFVGFILVFIGMYFVGRGYEDAEVFIVFKEDFMIGITAVIWGAVFIAGAVISLALTLRHLIIRIQMMQQEQTEKQQ
jgi:hypothetical protein